MGPGIVPARLQFKYSKKKNVDPCKLEKRLCLDAEGLDISVAGLSYQARHRSGQASLQEIIAFTALTV